MMAEFLTNLDIELIDEKTWRLTGPLAYQSDIAGRITVPVGFVTDLASVPRVPLAYMAWGDRAHREAVVHDYLCCIGCAPDLPLNTVNRVFLEAILHRLTIKNKEQNWFNRAVSKARVYAVAYPMYWGVCLGCWLCFKQRHVTERM